MNEVCLIQSIQTDLLANQESVKLKKIEKYVIKLFKMLSENVKLDDVLSVEDNEHCTPLQIVADTGISQQSVLRFLKGEEVPSVQTSVTSRTHRRSHLERLMHCDIL